MVLFQTSKLATKFADKEEGRIGKYSTRSVIDRSSSVDRAVGLHNRHHKQALEVVVITAAEFSRDGYSLT